MSDAHEEADINALRMNLLEMMMARDRRRSHLIVKSHQLLVTRNYKKIEASGGKLAQA